MVTGLYITQVELAMYADMGYPLAQLAGDYNDDDTVDAADYVLWRNSQGQIGSNLPADGDLDNRMDTATTTSGERGRYKHGRPARLPQTC